MRSKNFLIFFVSFFCILLELFFTRILNVKTWNHIVYLIIPFAILGYGIGANIYLLLAEKINRLKQEKVFGFSLLALAVLGVASTLAIIYFPLRLRHLIDFFNRTHSGMLGLAYMIVLLPFLSIGFLVTYLFSTNHQESHKLYFFDLLGAGAGAYAFFPLIENLGVFR